MGLQKVRHGHSGSDSAQFCFKELYPKIDGVGKIQKSSSIGLRFDKLKIINK